MKDKIVKGNYKVHGGAILDNGYIVTGEALVSISDNFIPVPISLMGMDMNEFKDTGKYNTKEFEVGKVLRVESLIPNTVLDFKIEILKSIYDMFIKKMVVFHPKFRIDEYRLHTNNTCLICSAALDSIYVKRNILHNKNVIF